MGSGKTTCGRLVATALDMPFFDIDDVIVRRAGASIADIFSQQGEEAFRALERQVLGDAAKLSGSVIAVGGGAVTHAEFAALAASGVVVVLQCDATEAAKRLGHEVSHRPLLKDAGDADLVARLEELMTKRAADYGSAGEQLNTTGLTPEQVASALEDRIHAAAAGAVIAIGPVAIGTESLEDLSARIRAAVPDAYRVVVVTDAAVRKTADQMKGALQQSGLQTMVLELPAGEQAKSLENVASLWTQFGKFSLSRRDVVIAVGGGAALDAAGFAAATFARGVNLINIPTTLLAMVDASIGGKVGIDYAETKNAVGAFHQAYLVVADVANLDGLPAATLRQGLAEVVKAAVLASPIMLDALEEMTLDDNRIPHQQRLAWLVEQAVRIKLAYVSADPKDNELRHSLNLGHTFAHALESATNYEMSHGEAVAIGLVNAARLGESAGVTEPGTATRLVKLLERLGMPVEIPGTIDLDVAAARMQTDKKQRDGQIAFVIPAPGGCGLLTGMDPRQALTASSLAPV
jgi:3-dehydroquinate synthase